MSDEATTISLGLDDDSRGQQDDESDEDTTEEDSEKGCCEAFTASFRLLCHNRRLTMVILAASLQTGSSGLANIFVLSNLKVEFWGKRMSEYTALSSILLNVVAVVCGGPYGRFSDSVDRRLAASIFAVGTFLPGWSLLICGQNQVGLMAATIAGIIGSFGLTSNVMLALANDVTPFKDREVACGTFFACMNLVSLLMNAVPVLLILVLRVVPNSPTMILWSQLVLSFLCFFCIWSVKNHKQRDPEETHHHIDCCSQQDSEGSAPCRIILSICEPMKLAFGNGRLRRLCIAAFCLKFGGDLVMDIGMQFFNDTLGLLENTEQLSESQRDNIITVAVLTMLPGQLMAIPGNLITGYLAKTAGTLKLLRIMIPISSLLVSVGALMVVVRKMWFIAVVVVCLNYAALPSVPLLRMVVGVAPPTRMGEALASVGVFAQSAGLIGNFIVAVVNPALLRTSLKNPLWVYYPACSIIVLLALIPLTGSPKGGWGPASGKPKEILRAFVSGVVSWNRWKRFVCANRVASGKNLSSEQFASLASHRQSLSDSQLIRSQLADEAGSSDEECCLARQ